MTDPLFFEKPLTFNEKAHRYYYDGKPVPSVTTIINRLSKPALIQWAADMAVEHIIAGAGKGLDFDQACGEARYAHQSIKEAAGDVGKTVHKYAQRWLERLGDPSVELPPLPGEAQAAMAIVAFQTWTKQHDIKPVAVERRIYCRTFNYAGTCDFLGQIDGRLSVLDFKTGNGVYDEAWWQLSAYEMAIIEEMGIPTPGLPRWVVHLNKNTGECAPYSRSAIEDSQQDRAVWTHLVQLDQALRAARKQLRAKAA